MTVGSPAPPPEDLQQAYELARGRYATLEIPAPVFVTRLAAICAQHASSAAVEGQSSAFIATLHVADLYLALGCAAHIACAWTLFAKQYHDYIRRLAAAVSASGTDALELTDCVFADLYLPARCGRSRISLYDGRSSLATWLRVLVCHRAINERKRWRPQTLDVLPDTPDENAVRRIHSEVRVHRYGAAVQDALRAACAGLTHRERDLLLMRYERLLKVQDIADSLKVHPSNITRQISRVCERLRLGVIRALGERHHFSPGAIEECLLDIIEDPSYSVLPLLQNGSPVAGDLPARRARAAMRP
jgi:RNA polymerase sigma-70 factor